MVNPFRNILKLSLGDFFAKTFNFIAFLYLARVLGVTSFGTLEFAVTILTYFTLLADGGLEFWSTREVAHTGDVRQLVQRIVPLRLILASARFFGFNNPVTRFSSLSRFATAVSSLWINPDCHCFQPEMGLYRSRKDVKGSIWISD